MDPFEAAPVNYSRDVVVVESDGERVAAWTYFANAAVVRHGLRPERQLSRASARGTRLPLAALLRMAERDRVRR